MNEFKDTPWKNCLIENPTRSTDLIHIIIQIGLFYVNTTVHMVVGASIVFLPVGVCLLLALPTQFAP
jgi:hypothetical protein